MNKILIEIYIPSVNHKIDMYIPDDIKIHEVLEMIKKSINNITQLSNNMFLSTLQTVLCDRNTGSVLDINMDASELCLHNGSQLLLI